MFKAKAIGAFVAILSASALAADAQQLQTRTFQYDSATDSSSGWPIDGNLGQDWKCGVTQTYAEKGKPPYDHDWGEINVYYHGPNGRWEVDRKGNARRADGFCYRLVPDHAMGDDFYKLPEAGFARGHPVRLVFETGVGYLSGEGLDPEGYGRHGELETFLFEFCKRRGFNDFDRSSYFSPEFAGAQGGFFQFVEFDGGSTPKKHFMTLPRTTTKLPPSPDGPFRLTHIRCINS